MKVKLDTMDVHFKAIMEQETFKEVYHPGHEGAGPITSLGVQLQTTFGCRRRRAVRQLSCQSKY